MLRQPVPLVSVGLRSKPRSIFPSAPLMRCLATACSRTAAALGSAVNQAAAGVRIAKTPLMVMSLLASSFAWSSEPTAANRVTFTSLDQVTRVAIATGEKVVVQAIWILQASDGLVLHLPARCNSNPGHLVKRRECNSVRRSGFRAPGK